MLKTQKDVPMVEKLYDTLFLVWKTYHYSAKSRRDLSALGAELGVNVRVATNVKGTRWVPHVHFGKNNCLILSGYKMQFIAFLWI